MWSDLVECMYSYLVQYILNSGGCNHTTGQMILLIFLFLVYGLLFLLVSALLLDLVT